MQCPFVRKATISVSREKGYYSGDKPNKQAKRNKNELIIKKSNQMLLYFASGYVMFHVVLNR